MNELKFNRARAGVWTRYLNIPLLFWFSSDVPMPADKHLLALASTITLVGNVIFHVHLELTRRFRVGSYLMLTSDQVVLCLSLYATGVAVSPFLLLFPLHAFSAFFIDFDKRASILFGVTGMIMIGAVYAFWWSGAPAAIVWDPRAYRVWVWTVCAIQLLTLCAYIFLATETNPLVVELARREQTLLKQAHRAELGTSLSMIAHELRNPMTTIGFSLELVRQAARVPGADPKLVKAANTAEAELARMSRMVQDVLSFARERRGRMHPATQSPAELFDRAVEFLRLKWGRHRKSFALETDLAGAPAVVCDADAMHQVLVNVLDNAIQHAAPDRPLRIEIRQAVAPGRLSLLVRDNGSGISAARLARLFEGFVTDRSEGTGLGMVITRQLMEDQSGTIEVSSVEGAGTTVVLGLPIAGRAPEVALESPAASSVGPAPARPLTTARLRAGSRASGAARG